MLLFNSLTKKTEEFIPNDKKKVRMYVCGITPNNATHIGHAFTYTTFDVLNRYLTFKGYDVAYLQNYTDVNDSDDVIKQAKELNKTWNEVADMWVSHFKTQMKALSILEPTYYKAASSAVPTIIKINKDLIKKGIAYEKNGNVYFDTQKADSYGKLSKFTKEQMIIISRDRGNNPEDPNKKNPLDFVLWIAADSTPTWDSPWGKGRPGWHIECSALNLEYLGEHIDIHGGGRDLIFPHHESEIAQSESYTEKVPFSKVWMHTAMVLFEGEKMSKSLGNLVLVEDMLKKYSANSIRWYLLSHHYRKPWEFIEEELADVEKMISKIEKSIHIHCDDKSHVDESKVYEDRFICALDNDLDTPKALSIIEELTKFIVANQDLQHVHDAQHTLKKLLNLLGFTF